jgi:polyisoprenyl-teichoic acid--peptidoglycan teichoic acid transferase
MRSSTRVVLLVVVVLVLAAGGFLVARLATRWSTPLGPRLTLQLSTDTPSPPPAATPTTAPGSIEATAPEPSATVTPPANDSLVILAVGADNSAGYIRGLADVTRVVRVDFTNARITMLAFPRDLWVRIPGIQDHYGLTKGKLNQSYFYGNLYAEPGGAGPGLLARTLYENYGLPIDNYVAVNMTTFTRIVDALGGVDIFLPRDVDGTTSPTPLPYFGAGWNHFNGAQALAYSRIRKIDTELDRIDRQTEVLCALRAKATSAGVLPRIPAIIESFIGNVLTDLTPEQISRLVALAPTVGTKNIFSASIPRDMMSEGTEPVALATPPVHTFVWHGDEARIRDLVRQFLDGTYPAGPGNSPCQ